MWRASFPIVAASVVSVGCIQDQAAARPITSMDPDPPGQAAQSRTNAIGKAAGDVRWAAGGVSMHGDTITVYGVLVRDTPSDPKAAPRPPASSGLALAYFSIRVKDTLYRIDTSKYPGLGKYLNDLPYLRTLEPGTGPLVRLKGKLSKLPLAPGAEPSPVITVTFFQPLEHAKEMGAPPAPKKKVSEIVERGGLAVYVPKNDASSKAVKWALTHAGLDVYDTLDNPESVILYAKLPDRGIDPYLIGSLKLDPQIDLFGYKDVAVHLPEGEEPTGFEPSRFTPAHKANARPN
jgi:hypothetical protein